MRLAKWVVLVTLTVAMATYGVDCGGMVKPEQAMHCCQTMRCHADHHGSHDSQDCCKATLQVHAALGQPSSVQGICSSLVVFYVVETLADSHIFKFWVTATTRHSHDPPISCSTLVLALRI